MTDRYERLSALLQSALDTFPADIAAEVAAKGVNTHKCQPSPTIPGAFLKDGDYVTCLLMQYPAITQQMLDTFQQRVDAAIGEVLANFPITTCADAVRNHVTSPEKINIDAASLKALGDVMPVAVMRFLIQHKPAFGKIAVMPNVGRFLTDYKEVIFEAMSSSPKSKSRKK